MQDKLKQLCKSSHVVYMAYYYIMSLILKFVGIFVRTDDKLILFVVYGGQRYDDSPRFIYEYMKAHAGYQDYRYIWAFIEPDAVKEIPDAEKVRIDTLRYYMTALKAKYWLSNSSASRGLNFKKQMTKNVFFTHGMTGIKKIGRDMEEKNKSFKNGFDEKFDVIVIEGKKEDELLKHAWNISGKELYKLGLPRNDELLQKTSEDIRMLKQKLKIPFDKKVILYAPTFREYNRDSSLAVFLKPPFDFNKWQELLGDRYILLLTAHYEVAKLMDIPENHPFIINAFKYPCINDLMLVSDLLISDYSSIIWDYSILGKPIISYAYDFEDYQKERGIYDGYEKIFSHGIMKSEQEMISFIQNMDYEAECEYTKKYIRDEYVAVYGNAAGRCVQLLFDENTKKE